jgi:hypothetical protein
MGSHRSPLQLADACTCRQGDDGPPARVIVFAATEEQAAAIAEPLRNVLWGEHSIAVLLPGGQEPIQVRNQKPLQAHPSPTSAPAAPKSSPCASYHSAYACTSSSRVELAAFLQRMLPQITRPAVYANSDTRRHGIFASSRTPKACLLRCRQCMRSGTTRPVC